MEYKLNNSEERKKKVYKTIYFVPLTGHNLIALVYHVVNASR